MSKKNLIALILCVLIIVGAGYVILSREDTSPGREETTIETTIETKGPLTAEQVRDKAVDAAISVNSYRFSMESTIGTGEDTLKSESNGSVDIQNKRMQIIAGDGNISQVMYLIDNVMYTDVFGEWKKEAIPGGQDAIEHQKEMIKDAEVKLAGEENVGGVDCYMLEVSPDKVKALDLDALDLDTGKLEEVLNGIESVTLTEWVGKKDYLIRKSRIRVVEVSGRWTDTSIVFYDYNKPLNIELPEEAVNATEM